MHIRTRIPLLLSSKDEQQQQQQKRRERDLKCCSTIDNGKTFSRLYDLAFEAEQHRSTSCRWHFIICKWFVMRAPDKKERKETAHTNWGAGRCLNTTRDVHTDAGSIFEENRRCWMGSVNTTASKKKRTEQPKTKEMQIEEGSVCCEGDQNGGCRCRCKEC